MKAVNLQLGGGLVNLDFNNDWTFCKEGCTPITVNLPHDAMLAERRDPGCRNGKNSGYFPGGKYRYIKILSLREADLGKSIGLFFEGVYQNCRILVNDAEAGTHNYGFTEFFIELSDKVHAGDNTITVLVDNSLEPNCRWYSGSGIYRPVHLMIRDKLSQSTLRITTKSYDPAIINIATDDKAIIEIYEEEKLIASGAAGEFKIPNAKLWSAETPNLYTCVSRLGTEELRIKFGIRRLEWSASAGLLVNGKEVLLRGGCIHSDNGVIGACTFADAEERRVRILKEAGYNAIRCAHNPASRALLDACDRLGMYVMDEAFDGWYTPKTYHDYSRWFYQEWQGDISAMVEKDRNHPCVIMYSIGNEVSETASKKGVDICETMSAFVRSLDDTRPVTCGINVLLNVFSRMGLGVYRDKGHYQAVPLPNNNGRYREKKTGSLFFNSMAQRLGSLMFFMSRGKKGDRACSGAAKVLDIIGLNYASSRYDSDAADYPERIMAGSETLASDLPYNWERVKKHKALIGDFVWAAWDYIGEAGIGDWMYNSYPGLPLLAGSGTIDITGKIGAEAYFQQIVWGLRDRPFICVRPLNHSNETASKSAWRFTDAIDSWNWQGYNDKKAVVEVYSDAPAVELYLNGKLICKKKIKKYKAIFNVHYQPGILTAVSLNREGNEISRSSLMSGGNGTILRAVPEKATLHANGQELCYLPIEFTDSDGNVKPFIEKPVEIEVKGSVSLQGFGSAIVKTDETFSAAQHRSFRGRALAVLRAGFEAGSAKVIVKSDGYEPVTVILEVI